MLSSPMMRGLLGVAAAMAVSACDDGNSYPKEVRQAFMTSCTAGSPEPLCGCVLSALEKKYTYAQYQEWEQRAVRGDTTAIQEIHAMRQQCAPAPPARPQSLGMKETILASIKKQPVQLGICGLASEERKIASRNAWLCDGQHALGHKHRMYFFLSDDGRQVLQADMLWKKTPFDTPLLAFGEALGLSDDDLNEIGRFQISGMKQGDGTLSNGAAIRQWSTFDGLPGVYRVSIYTAKEPFTIQ